MSLRPQDPNDPLINIWKRTHAMSKEEYLNTTTLDQRIKNTLLDSGADENRKKTDEYLRKHPSGFDNYSTTNKPVRITRID